MKQDLPNILFITADQWRGDTVAYAGNKIVKTQNIDSLAAEGVAFLQHYAAAAPCSPARAAMYTGLYQMNNRVTTNGTPLAGSFDNMARAARRAGYTPTLFGYTDIAADPREHAPNDPAARTYEGVLPGFDVGQSLFENAAPWKNWLRKRGHTLATLKDPYLLPPPDGEVVPTSAAAFGEEETQTAYLAGRFLDWFDEQCTERPWFAHLSLIHPHPPFVAPAPFNDMYAPDAVPPLKGGDAADEVFDRHPLVKLLREQSDASSFVPGIEGSVAEFSAHDFQRIKGVYYGLISEVDAQLGHIFDHLKASGAWENTFIVFTSDHGEMMGDHAMLGKGGFYPQSQHVPLIMKLPYCGPQPATHAKTSAVDLFPTLLDLMQLTPENDVNGQSLLPFLKGEKPENWRDSVIWEFDFRHLQQNLQLEKCVLPEDHQLMVRMCDNHLFAYSPSLPPVLFDLQADPDCCRNLWETEDGKRMASPLLQSMLQERMRAANDTLVSQNVLFNNANG
ncbi:sulfatase-like hydrolase/transferase [Polycladidibacter hongkongensis]|uniref:sulfatase-like hydrolase/transferase n=1 Tax=Polycladidibacter hongkongensis TaxID=1647556 RepID=UPI00082DE53C|nr:sulfatase-like hydrolase/transferase [Pseudovibrio hongkongensis]